MTFTTSDLHNPLQINLQRQTRALLDLLPDSPQISRIKLCTSNSQILQALSVLLADAKLTLLISALFRPVLLDLCARWLDDEDEIEKREDQLVALALLIEVHEELYPILNELLLKPVFANGPLGFVTSPPSPLSFPVLRLHRLLIAYYRIQQANRELPLHLLWSLTPLSYLVWTPHLDNGVRLLGIRCYALQSGMAECEREKMEREVLGESCGVECRLFYGETIAGKKEEADGWLLPLLELKRVKAMRDGILNPMDYYSQEIGDGFMRLRSSDLSPRIANIHGVFLTRSPTVQPGFSSLVATPTAIQALRSLALHISTRLPVLLTSSPSAGKSTLLTHLVALLYPRAANQIISIHLADTSLDPRALLGSYISSPTHPGTFEWKEGVLVRAMREGRWVVFEDIDRGSSEVLGVLKPLVESLRLGRWIGGRACIQIPNRGNVVAHEEFALFATRSVVPLRDGSFPAPVFFGAHKFHEVEVGSPSPQELRMIVESRFPKLAGAAAEGVIRMWDAIKALGSAASSREIGLRELEKFCFRIERLLPNSATNGMDMDEVFLRDVVKNPSVREDVYLEARDVFFGAGTLTSSAQAHVQAIALTVGDHLGLEQERMEWILNGRTPEFHIEKDVNGRTTAICIARTRLSSKDTKAEIDGDSLGRPFAMHRPAILLLSRISTCVSLAEPVLLTGETGTGKTSVITHLASLLRRPLVSLNLSHQTESADLLGGFKPIDARIPAAVLQEQFLELFGGTFSRKKNEKFEGEVRKSVREGKWRRAVSLWKESVRLARERILARQDTADDAPNTDVSRKRRKVEKSELNVSDESWAKFLVGVEEFEVQHVHGKGKFAFGFVEGPLVKALRSGDWVLLDEINLASSETLECISGLLNGPTASITLTEQGSLEPVPRHPDFRLFACMNPATDVGKKDLPPNIRSRFTEIDVPPPDADKDTLLSIVSQYIGAHAVGNKGAIMNVAEFYAAVKDLAEKRQIADGSNHRPHYSMRTLARALTFAADTASTYSLQRSIWEGCLMAFTMVLDRPSAEIVTELAMKHLLSGVKNPPSILMKEPSPPRGRPIEDFVKIGHFYLERGPLPEDPMDDYITTPSVAQKLVDLARIIITRRFPILIEGPTSSGKTSSIEYLAKRTGHHFVRINNHEHTDIQEYIGSYVSDPLTGKLVFKDGLLVRALRNGHWIVLDELNLAPTDVLEALNRLLDDNRELVVPETQEVIRPHPHFVLFATQNPPGLYAGRKVLSRAFRNRFLEVHFEDVPQAELETILCQRCRVAPSYGKRIVSVFIELQKRRQAGRIFESKHGFATLRDLFRWAGRDAMSYQELANNGYMLLAERARRDDDKIAVKEVIESIMGAKIDEKSIYNLHNPAIDYPSFLGCPIPKASSNIVWTTAMQRLFILIGRALRFNEPVLLVGETGSGKTSVCQIFANASSQRLHGLNCHQNTETADLIGGLRPLRNRGALEAEVFRDVQAELNKMGVTLNAPTINHLSTALNTSLRTAEDHELRARLMVLQERLNHLNSIFEWHDGPLIEAMRNGDVFLLDEISLADDSVLERLNSVLEPARTIVLAERGGDDSRDPSIQADPQFKLISTMNPGGDFGKKELSPALRNRFTEIWVPRVDARLDLELIVGSLWKSATLQPFTSQVLDFVEWLCAKVGDQSLVGLRDILAWVEFSNSVLASRESMDVNELFHHAAHMVLLDGLGSFPQLSSYSKEALRKLRSDAREKLNTLVPPPDQDGGIVLDHDTPLSVQFGPFAIPKGQNVPIAQSFNFQVPTTHNNILRLVRACQVPKPILLEGSPGVGKTSLVTALANIAGHRLCRINLSDQTDLVDLFGSDLPVEGGGPGEFAWKDAEFLTAMQDGHWVLLDEMNLAPQAVLEGLNAVLDHRGTVYIPELSRSFTRHPAFRIFAAQNPLNQGGGRKGLPKSFVNRFTKVYIEELSPDDLFTITKHSFPDIDEGITRAMISFNMRLNEDVCIYRRFGRDGGPWEFNLRDVARWATLIRSTGLQQHPVQLLRSVYVHRFRTIEDRQRACAIFEETFSISTSNLEQAPTWVVSPDSVEFGHFSAPRRNLAPLARPGRILKMQLSLIESIGHCISQSWLSILTGPRNSGKNELIKVLANLTGTDLHEVSINSATDTMDLLGSFEQIDLRGRVLALADDILVLLDSRLRTSSLSKDFCDQSQMVRNALRESDLTSPSLLHALLSSTMALRHELDFQVLHTRVEQLLSVAETVGRFEWVDGPLVRALKHGHWLLIDGANLCNPSVLDRLNSLCEPDGFLTLSERGYVDGNVQILKPHPNFRLFMTVDPQQGELSRAMRNRGIEISLLGTLIADDHEIVMDFLRVPPVLSSGNSKQGHLAFNAARRGVWDVSGEFQCISTSGRALDQDSALSNLVDHAPMLVASPTISTEISDAEIHFLSRTTTPAYLPQMFRMLNTLEIEDNLNLSRIHRFIKVFDGPLLPVLSKFRHSYALSNRHSQSILTKPVDFFLSLPASQASNLKDPASIHSILLGVLNLAASLFIHHEEAEHNKNAEEVHPTNAKHTREAIGLILVILQEVDNIGRLALENLTHSESPDMHEYLQLAQVALRFGRQLGRVLQSSPFDFSAVHAITRWIVDELTSCPPHFLSVRNKAKTLYDTVTSSSGIGLIDIWLGFFSDQPLIPPTELHELDFLSCRIIGPTAKNLRRSTFDLLALCTLPFTQESDNTRILQLKTELESRLVGAAKDTSSQINYSSEPLSIVAELGVLVSSGEENSRFISQSIEEILSVACDEHNRPLIRFVPYQHLLWATVAQKETRASFIQAQLHWFEGLWSIPPTPAGAAMLLHPTQLQETISICDWSETALLSLSTYQRSISRRIQLELLQCERRISRIDQLSMLFCQNLAMIVSCFPSSFSVSPLRTLQSCVFDPLSSPTSYISELFVRIEQFPESELKKALRSCIIPRRISEPSPNRQEVITEIGIHWIALGRLLVQLFVPKAPIDPAAVENYKLERLREEQFVLNSEVYLHSELEKFTTGNDTNELLVHLQTKLQSVERHLGEAPVYPDRKDTSRLHMFWSEVTQFQTHLLEAGKFDGLIFELKAGGENSVQRENVTQKTIAGFCQRLNTVYTEYGDVIAPLQLALDYIRLGLRIFVDASTSASTSDVATSALVAFPTVRGLEMFSPKSGVVGSTGINTFHHLILALSGVALESTLGVVPRTYAQTIDVSYEQALRLWLIDRAKENEEEEASQMLYRRKGLDHDDIGDAEMEEAEFLALFPLFEDILNPDASHTPQTEGRSKPSHHIDLSGSLQLLEIHYGLFGTSSSFDGLGPRLSVFNKHRESAITSLLKTQMMSLSDNMDIESVSLQLSILRRRQISLERPIESNLGYNFYQDANVVEAKKSAAVVTALKERLEGIIQEWPDQMVLQHINARCDTFLALTLQSPLAKILSALEQLLAHTEDWQIYANRDNSLKTHQQALIELIVTWRRLELTCWQGLLAAQLQAFEEGVSDWWFRLYDATVRGVLDASQREDTGDLQSLTNYLDSLLPLLDDFLRSSPLGQFQARMRLLHSFETYLLRLSQHKPPSQQLALNRAYHLLHATKRHFNLFTTSLSAHLSEKRSLLEKEIKGYIKLASWKDINVQALKESAKRTHHQLYKIIRKFREILRQPILEHLHISPANDTESKPSVLPVLPVLADVAPVHLELSDSVIVTPAGSSLDFNKTLGKFVTLASTRVQHLIKSQAVQSVDDLAVEIITTSTSLASHAIPSDVSPEARAKQSKALLVRKKRAWGDLLKELKRGGLAVNVKPEILHRQSEVRWIREQAVMPALSLEETSSLPISKIENYFARVAGVLPELRQTMVTHHPDLTTRELHRGAMLLESGFSFAVELRQRLAEALNQFDIISKTHKRLRTLAEQAPPIQPASNLAERVSKISDIICRLASAFHEIQQEMRTFHDLKPKHTISASIFEKVDANYTKITSLRTRLLNVVENVSMTPIAFAVADEESVIFEAVSHIAETVASLRSWTTVQPNLTHLFKPTADWLESQQFPALLPPKIDGPPQTDPTNALINTLLVVLQGLNAQCPPDCADDVPEPDAEADLYISQSCRTTLQLTHHLHADSINTHLHNVLIHLSRINATQTPSLHTHVLSRILPFLDIYLMLFRNQLRAHAYTAHALFKLNLVLSTLLRNLAVQGFCQPPEGDSAAEAGSDKAEVGMGLGEGTGAEDVSKDIEEESQVEGLKGDDAEEQKAQDRAEGGDAIEMSEDFGGEMEDVPEDEEEDGGEGEDGEENDVEEKAGGLDEADPEAVDEKLWGDEEGPGDGDDKIGQDRAEEKEGDGDVIAKEGGRQDKDKKQEKQEPKNAENKEAETNDTDGEIQSDQGEGPEDEENDPNVSGAPMDEHVQEAETLDLPDDMDLGLGEEMAGEPEMEDEGEDMNEDDGMHDDGVHDLPEQQGQENDMENEGDHGADGPQEVDEIGDDTQKNDTDPEGESAEPAVAQPDVSAGDGQASSNDASNPDTGNRTSTGQTVGATAGTPGNEQMQEDSEEPKDSNFPENDATTKPPAEQTTTTSRSTEAQESGAADQGTQRGGADAPMDEQPRRANPLQNLGDALKEIKQRFDEILDASEENRMDGSGTDLNPSRVEHVHPDDDAERMQALGAAGDEQAARLEELKIVDGDDGMDVDVDVGEELEKSKEDATIAQDSSRANPLTHTAPDRADDIEGAVLQSGKRPRTETAGTKPSDIDMDDEEDPLNETVETQLRAWQAADCPAEDAENIWRLYESLTQDLSYALCEQLRLTLEPTLATRLRGDYRTGKRLNMKKIIPYIASDYTKDKIWLRRTRPSDRAYQILLALDDSRSMAETHSVHLAFGALALVGRALARLEAGEVAVARFGAEVEVLHGFGEGPFGDEAGKRVMSAFRFGQRTTDVLKLLETSLGVLERARESRSGVSGGAADLWQLEIIISDGMCQDHERMRSVLRRAEEMRVMVVFIIIDAVQANASQSILAMDKAEYKMVDGRMELQLNKYLDSFPFEYYVVLRDVEALPDVLASTLRQFFERISEE